MPPAPLAGGHSLPALDVGHEPVPEAVQPRERLAGLVSPGPGEATMAAPGRAVALIPASRLERLPAAVAAHSSPLPEARPEALQRFLCLFGACSRVRTW